MSLTSGTKASLEGNTGLEKEEGRRGERREKEGRGGERRGEEGEEGRGGERRERREEGRGGERRKRRGEKGRVGKREEEGRGGERRLLDTTLIVLCLAGMAIASQMASAVQMLKCTPNF